MFCGLCQTSLFPEWMASMETEEQQSFLLSPVPLGPLSSRSLDYSFISMGEKCTACFTCDVREGPEPVYKLLLYPCLSVRSRSVCQLEKGDLPKFTMTKPVSSLRTL